MIGGNRVKVVSEYPDGEIEETEVSRIKLRDYLEEEFASAIVADYGVGPDPEDEEADEAAIDDAIDSILSNYEMKGDTTIYHYTSTDGDVTTWTVMEL
jgi:hypothetical protein